MINQKLIDARERKNWTQEDLATWLQTTPVTISRWENGSQRPRAYMIRLLCQAFDLSAEELGLAKSTSAPPQSTSAIITLSKEQVASLLLLVGDDLMTKFDTSRRTILQLLGLTTLTTLTSSDLFDPEPWERLAQSTTKPASINPETLAHFSKINEGCWYITNGTETAVIGRILPAYLPQLSQFTNQSSKLQQQAAHLTAQGYLLAGLVALDQMNTAAMEKYSKLAVHYSSIAKDSNLANAALKQQATLYGIAKNPAKALQSYQQSMEYIDQISPLLKSRTYQGLACMSARCGNEQDALRYLGLAYDTFPKNFEADPSYLYADSGLSVLYMYSGLTRLELDQPREAWNAFAKVDGLKPKIPIGKGTQLEFINLQAKAAIALGNMDVSCHCIEAALDEATAMNSQWGRTDAWEAYQQVKLIWPRESKVKSLAEHFH